MEHKRQYQHFVPQFLLRNFAHPYKPPGGRKKGRRRDANAHFGESVVRNLDIRADPPTIRETPVKRILGQMNMYEETAKTSKKQRHLEELLGQLENQASRVFRKITKAYETRETTGGQVRLTRQERDLIRKFLFILKYRSSGFHDRFFLDTADEYMLDDRELLREYMAERGYERPMDVWYDNLEAIINLDMDPEGNWINELPKRMYQDDAVGFIMHCQGYYMAICTPSDPDGEFILTDASYNVFEGPSTFVKDENTGVVEGSAYTPLHLFATVSPKLMIVLRSLVLPDALEDANLAVKAERETYRFMAVDSIYGEEVKGLLYDLPIAKARNNYTQVINGRLEAVEGFTGEKTKDDAFFFTIFPIGTDYVNTINSFFLDHLEMCSCVVFDTVGTFAKTIEWFLTNPACRGRIDSGVKDDPRMAAFKKLEIVSRALGSTKDTCWPVSLPPPVYDYEKYRLAHVDLHRHWKKIVVDKAIRRSRLDPEGMGASENSTSPPLGPGEGPSEKTYRIKNYERLGGSSETLFEDIRQALLMWQLRVMIDSWSQGVDEAIRQRNRDLLTDAYLRLPPRRFFEYVRVCRRIMVSDYHPLVFGKNPQGRPIGPEDILAQAHDLIPPENMNRLLHNATTIDIQQRLNSWPNLWDRATPFTFPMLLKIIPFTVLMPGYIRECGIQQIENLARRAQVDIIRSGKHKLGPENSRQNGRAVPSVIECLDEGDRVELLTRTVVRKSFEKMAEGRVEEPLRGRLELALFDFAYPTPPREWWG